jgi:hypothetical protein
MSTPIFDDLADVYEAMIDWPNRLANEEGFFRGLFERVGARSVLDAACGTGHHAALFASWGLRVEGADISPAMVERARAQFGESESLRWVVRGFDQAIPEPGAFDVAICIGNSLALSVDEAAVATAIRHMFLAVRDGGAAIVHVVNLWRLADGPCNWQKCVPLRCRQWSESGTDSGHQEHCSQSSGTQPQGSGTRPQSSGTQPQSSGTQPQSSGTRPRGGGTRPPGESLIVKGVRRCGAKGYVDLLVIGLAEKEPQLRTDCVPFLGLEAGTLARMALEAGASGTEFYGGYQRQGYRREQSQDLIMIATKA